MSFSRRTVCIRGFVDFGMLKQWQALSSQNLMSYCQFWNISAFNPMKRGEPANLDEPICKICRKRVPVTHGNTSNLRCHLANCHPAIEAQLPPQALGRGATSKRNQFSSLNMTPYMSLTVHYLSMEWTLKSRCLETVFMPENHTSDNIFRCSPTRIWRVVPGWEEVGLYHYRQRGQHRCSSQKVELAVAELLWSQFTFGSYKRNGKRYGPHCSRNGPVSHLGQ